MIKYRVNNKFVDEDVFYEMLRKMYDAKPQNLTFEECLVRIKTEGCVCLQAKRKSYYYECFYCADEDVFEMECIIMDNEFDPLDDDAFNIAYALYKQGFKKCFNINPTK